MGGELYTRVEPILLPSYPRFVYLVLLEQGIDEDKLFAGLNFSAQDLHDETYRLSIEQHERFILRVLELTGDPHFALVMNRQQEAVTGNFALLAVANSGQIAKALHMICRYFKIVTRVFSIQSFEQKNHPLMEIEVHLEHRSVIYFAMSSFALFLDGFFADVLRGRHLVQRVELDIPAPAGFDKVAELFPFDMSFSCAKTRVYFDRDLLDQPMRQADPQTVRLLIEMSDRQLQEAEAEMSFVGAVRALLIDQIAAPPKLDEAARQLGVSSRGLRRKLADAGTTYQQLLDGIRLKMALKLLRESAAPVASIAYELGFNNASDFGRAFKRWGGRPPSAVRSRQA